ncbi:MAG TPA: glycosyltransferase [Candidatus Gracilibacteria bacterium]|nr:glycosyltransferase [Candidatus Gracilibacteria bacterium]
MKRLFLPSRKMKMVRPEKNTLPPDLYSRNTVISYLAEKLIPQGEIRVLDVGGYGGKLNWFLPDRANLTILDLKEKPEDEDAEYRQGDARRIPFSDGNFDLVVSSDTLEHIDKSERAPVIREMLRVSKNHLILAAPCRSHMVENAEENVMLQFKDYTGSEHPFLSEHKDLGLPEEEKIETVLQKEGLQFMKLKEGNLMNWYIQQLYAGIQHGRDVSEAQFAFYRFFNENLSDLGNLRAPAYRTIYIIAKDGVLPSNEIHEELIARHVWNPEKFMELLRHAFKDLQIVMEEKSSKLRVLEGAQGQKNDELIRAETALAELKRKYEEEYARAEHSTRLLGERNAEVAKQEAMIMKARKSIEAHREAIMEVRNFLMEKEKTVQLLKGMLAELGEKEKLLRKQSGEQEQMINEMKTDAVHSAEELQTLRDHRHKLEQALTATRENEKGLAQQLHAVHADLGNHRRELQKVISSRAWKVVLAYGKVKRILITRPVELIKKARDIQKTLGFAELMRRITRKLKPDRTGGLQSPYGAYLEQYVLVGKQKKEMKNTIEGFEYRPVISIVMPVHNIEQKWLTKAIESVRKQVYGRWELCICDDASTQSHIKPLLEKYAREDSRIKIAWRQKNGGIVKASNDALKLATGAYVGFLDNDDELTENALFEVVNALQETRYEFLYSDEDKIDMDGKLCDPFFKPDWSPDLLFSNNYICHFSVYRRKIVEQVGGLREGFDGSQDYDLALRFTEKTQSIHHIAKILYHWRKIPGSTAAVVDAKPYAFTSAKKALEQAMKRRGITGNITDGIWTGSYRTRRYISGQPLVSIIIPFKDKVEILKPCYESIITKSTYGNYEILLVDNRSEKLETAEYLKTLAGEPKVTVLRYDEPFNFSAINNFAAKHAKGEILLMLNNDTEVLTPDWIECMLEHAQRPEVGAVGAKLLYPNNLVQHAGVLVGIGGIANHAFLKQYKDDHGYFGQADVVRNYSAVTAACMMVRRDVFEKMGGLNEKDLAVAFNDVDFCLRLREKGYLIVYTPYARLYHYESLSRGFEVNLKEVRYMQERHGRTIEKGDPYYNPNLTRERFDFSLKVLDKVRSGGCGRGLRMWEAGWRTARKRARRQI